MLRGVCKPLSCDWLLRYSTQFPRLGQVSESPPPATLYPGLYSWVLAAVRGWAQMSPLGVWGRRVCSWSWGLAALRALRADLTVALLISTLFSGADNLTSLSLFPPPSFASPSVGSTSSSPALLGIREPRSEYDRTQPPMQYYNSQGDTTHKGLYPGKTPAGCVMQTWRDHISGRSAGVLETN